MSYNNKNNVWGGKHPQGTNQMGSMSNINHSGMVPFQPQQQVFQNMGLNQQNLGLNQQNLGLGLQQMAANQLNFASNPIFQQQLSAVSYPNTRGLNPNAFQTPTNVQSNSAGGKCFPRFYWRSVLHGYLSGTKQKVFTGSITQLHENFGFIDDEVFFSRNVCLKGSTPMVGDRVLVEAAFNPSMPFKWNATRVQVMPNGPREQRPVEGNNTYPRRDFSRDPRTKPNVGERRNRSRERDDDEIERKRRREDRIREREKEDKERKSPVRRRSRSPKARRRTRTIPRYMVQIPKISLNLYVKLPVVHLNLDQWFWNVSGLTLICWSWRSATPISTFLRTFSIPTSVGWTRFLQTNRMPSTGPVRFTLCIRNWTPLVKMTLY